MKRFPSFLCFLMAAAISASLTGCGGSPGAGSSAQGQSADPPAQSAQSEAGTPAADPSGRRIIMCLERALPELCRRESPPPCPADQNRGRTSQTARRTSLPMWERAERAATTSPSPRRRVRQWTTPTLRTPLLWGTPARTASCFTVGSGLGPT